MKTEYGMNGVRQLSLQELCIWGGILVLLAVALPRLLRSQQVGKESSAVAAMRAINSAEARYRSSNGTSFGSFHQLIDAGVLDWRVPDSVPGYVFSVIASAVDYTVKATPRSANTARYGYYSTPDAVVRYQTTTTAECDPCFPNRQSGEPVE